VVARIIEACARHRLAVLAAVAVAAACGLLAMRRVQLDAIPDLGDPQVIVFSEWSGRSPTLVEDQVTYPLVTALGAAPRVADVRGYSMFGMSFVHVVFEEGTDAYWARSRVQELLGTARARLPEGVSPALGPDASGLGWAFQYTLVSGAGGPSLDELRAVQDFTLRYALGQVPGVAEVASVGGYQRQYQVTVDPDKLRAYGITLAEVAAKIRDANGDSGGRVLEAAGREYYVRGRGYIQDLAALERTAVAARGPGGVPILVKDLGAVRFGPDLRRGLLEWNGEGEAVGGIVVVRQGENVLEVVGRVKERLAALARALPRGVRVEVAYDRTDLIHRAVATLRRALAEEAAVVAAVILLFLLHVRSALAAVASLPIAILLAFVPMALFGVPATIMSLGGIAIALGATVDAEIVMIEASHKKLERAGPGADRRALLAEAAREVTPALFFSLLVIAAAFLPVFALGGQAGRLFRPLAFTKTFVMLAAAALSITFAPALRGLLLSGRIRSEATHPLSRALQRAYRPFVFVALRWPRSTVAIGLLAVLSAVPLALRLGHEFMPALDEGDLLYMPTTLPGISIEEAKRQLGEQDRILRAFPEVASVAGKAGRADTATDPAPLSMIETTIRLKPRSAWREVPRRRWWSAWAPRWLAPALRPLWPDRSRMTPDELTAQLDEATRLPGWTNAYTTPIRGRLDMLATGVRTPVGVKVKGADLAAIERAGVAIEALLRPIRGARSVLYERSQGGLYVDVVPDRGALARHGITVGDVERTVEAAVGGAPAGVTVEGRRRFSISVRYPEDLRSDVDALRAVLVPVGAMDAAPAAAASAGPPSSAPASGDGMAMAPPSASPPRRERDPAHARARFVPLGEVAAVRVTGGPPMLRDEGGLLTGYVHADVDPARRDVGGWVREAKRIVAEAEARGALALPEGTYLEWTGAWEEMERTNERLRLVVPAALLLVVLLLLLHFRNAAEVLIVLLSVPFALVGSVWLLALLDYRLSTAVWVGLLAVVGLAAQTGMVMILYIDQAYERRRREGRIRDLSDIAWAHMEGTVQRVRPKLMTVATMIAGLAPLLWATGSGADVMKRIAAPMVGGLVTSAFLTLEIIPVVYTYWRQEQLLWERLAGIDAVLLAALRARARLLGGACAALVAALVAPVYVDVPAAASRATSGGAAAIVLVAAALYLRRRRPAHALVWPSRLVNARASVTTGVPPRFA
jgi:copper/silver efflux system protein